MKDIQKNRAALIRYFMSLPGRDKHKSSMYSYEGRFLCLCAQGQVIKKFFSSEAIVDSVGDTKYPRERTDDALKFLDMDRDIWVEMESRYEGRLGFKKHSFKQVAQWLQTLPGWPQII